MPTAWAFDREVPPERGDICLVESMDRSVRARLGVALTDPTTEGIRSILIALVSADTDLATDNDLLVTRKAAQTGYDIMVRTDLVAPVFVVQVGARVGRLAPSDFAMIEAALAEGHLAIPIERRGLKMYPNEDPRLPVKDADGDALALLSADCVAELLSAEEVILTEEVYASNPLVLGAVAGRRVRMIGDLPVGPAALPPGFPEDVFAGMAMELRMAGVTTASKLTSQERVEVRPDYSVPPAVCDAIVAVGRRSVCVLSSSLPQSTDRVFGRLLHPSSQGVQGVQMVVENVYA